MAAPAAAQPATNTTQTNIAPTTQPQPVPQQPQEQNPRTPLPPLAALSPPPSNASVSSTSPSKTSLTNWWKGFKSKPLFRKGDEQEVAPKVGIFGISLNTSIEYAYVNISITNPSGDSEVYGRIPIIVAKCGVYLKDKATDVEGIFRVSGSAKRIKELQALFDSPPTYGKALDWDGFNVHDAANVFRRYINHLPEPIIPHDYYFAFRKPLEVENRDNEETIRTYQKLIGELPKLNGQLLLYILDLLAVFAENSNANLMPAANLAAIFQPGLISHPDHDMNPQEYKVSQEVLIFLIEHQDRFLPVQAVRRERSPARAPQKQSIAPPAKYSGTHLSSVPRPEEIKIPRRRTTPRRTEASPTLGKTLRRHRSSRTAQSPKLTVDDTEPRRVSEGNEPSSPIGEEDETPTDTIPRRNTAPRRLVRSKSYEEGREDVLSSPLSSPVVQSAEPPETSQLESTTKTVEVDMPQETAPSEVTERISDPGHVVGEIVTDAGVTKGTFLAVSSVPMGRSSSYREELDDVVNQDHGDVTTSADNTEAEASDSPDKKFEKNKRKSRLPWTSATDPVSGESKVSSIFSFASSTLGEEGKPIKKLQKKKRPKDDVKSPPGSAFSVNRPGTVMSQGSELSQSERADTLSPPPWTQHMNISQSSLNASDISRPSHISSNRSSVDVSRSGTPVDRPHHGAPTTFEELRQSNLMQGDDDDLPTRVVMPAAREEKQRTNSHSSTHSAASSGKGGNKFGAWLRKKRGYSVSSSTSAGGGGSAVSD